MSFYIGKASDILVFVVLMPRYEVFPMVSGKGQYNILSQAFEFSPATEFMYSSTSIRCSLTHYIYTSFLQVTGIIGPKHTILVRYNFETFSTTYVIVSEKKYIS